MKEKIIIEINPFNDDRVMRGEFVKTDLISRFKEYNYFSTEKITIRQYIRERMIQTAEEFLIDEFLGKPRFKITMG